MVADYATLLREHVTLECRSIDRVFLQAWVPKLQSVGHVCNFLVHQRGYKIPSSAAFGQIGDACVRQIHRWAREHGVPVVYFQKGENKEKVAQSLLDKAAAVGGDGQVVLVGIAQEKASAWTSWKAKGHEHAAHPHMEWARQMRFVNHFYFYLWDPDWGPAFWKTNAYAPYRCGCGSTGTNGPSGSWTGAGSPMRGWTTAFAGVRTPRRCSESATGSAPVRSAGSFGGGCCGCPRR